MAILQGENIKFKIVINDQDGGTITTNNITSISANLYNEASRKEYIGYSQIPPYDSIDNREILTEDDDSGYILRLYGVDTATLPPGRYIIEIKYTMLDLDFEEDGGHKIYKQNGALISVKKSI